MNSRAIKTIIGLGVLCSCTNQAPSASDVALEQSALTAEALNREDVGALKAVMFGVGHGSLVDQYWDHGSALMRSDPTYVNLADLLCAELVRRDPDCVSDFNDAIASGNRRKIRRAIERAEDCISDLLGGGSIQTLTRDPGSIDLSTVQTLDRDSGNIDWSTVQVLTRH